MHDFSMPPSHSLIITLQLQNPQNLAAHTLGVPGYR